MYVVHCWEMVCSGLEKRLTGLQAAEDLAERGGEETRGAGQVPAAVGHLSEETQEVVDGGEGPLERARLLCGRKEYKRALSEVEKALKIDGKNVKVRAIKISMHVWAVCRNTNWNFTASIQFLQK